MKVLFFAVCAAALMTLPAFAAPIATLCPKGTPTIIRVSTIKPTGTRAGFEKAVQDQIKWYRDNGMTQNEIVEAGVMTGSGSNLALSTTEVMTLHYNPPSLTELYAKAPDQASYTAFVAEFRENSDIVVEKTVCLPAMK